MEYKLTRVIKYILKNEKGMVAVIGDTFTGKTYTVNNIIKSLQLRVIPYDYENVPKGVNKEHIHNLKIKRGNTIQNFYKTKHGCNTICNSQQEVLFCDALETYSTSTLTFLKYVCEFIPVIITCDKSVVIPNIKLIERVWWNGKRRGLEDYKGDYILHTPRDLFTSLTQRRTPTEQAVRNFGSDSFLLTQYYHDEFPTYKNGDIQSIVRSTSALSMIDTFRLKEWESNGILSTSKVSEEIFVRTIRNIHKNPCLVPKGWFPRTLSKQPQITRKNLELANIHTQIPNIRDIIHIYNFKVGKSFGYKTHAKQILHKIDEKIAETYSRAIELTGNKGLTKTEIKKLIK